MSITGTLLDLEALLAEIGEVLSLVYLLATWSRYGITGIVLYILGWSVVSLLFQVVGKEIPSPVKVLWKIVEDLVGLFV